MENLVKVIWGKPQFRSGSYVWNIRWVSTPGGWTKQAWTGLSWVRV